MSNLRKGCVDLSNLRVIGPIYLRMKKQREKNLTLKYMYLI